MTGSLCAKYFVCALCAMSISANDISAQSTISETDTAYYRQKIAELDSELALKGIGNFKVYNLAAYHSIIGETDESIAYLQMAIDNGLLILTAVADADLENAQTAKEWPMLRKKIETFQCLDYSPKYIIFIRIN